MCFIVNDNCDKIGTATISLLENRKDEYEAEVDWVAIKKEYQGKGLSRPLISKLLEIANNLGRDKLMLHTQTHSWLAAKLYLDFGFEPYKMTNESEGWQILKTLIAIPSYCYTISKSFVALKSNPVSSINKSLTEPPIKIYWPSYSLKCSLNVSMPLIINFSQESVVYIICNYSFTC